jgi:hypothetical protein
VRTHKSGPTGSSTRVSSQGSSSVGPHASMPTSIRPVVGCDGGTT